ncbi:lytic transglycosylase domain-containing protein [Erythrobacter sp. JK5]|uniref:lytic transglycosylase domain-containing protein n=1 Tax=Erythrobacter sp. JK5 TaxID=2829500 RepID=UPI001BA90647|nr:lytic transglycosylase domain-containing protein [Erythrobacter sp. JK5]QUL38582.1 lytic transglycosylase domain-containing protein [Erythrobacter sp. JK5]
MMKTCFRPVLLAATLTTALAAPGIAAAQSQSMVAHYSHATNENKAVPSVLSQRERERYRDVFRAIDQEQWNDVEGQLDGRNGDVLHQVALAEYYTHANSPKVSAEQITRWFQDGVDLPQAEQLGRMGAKRGLEYLPAFPQAQSFRSQPSASKRIRPRPVDDGTMPSETKLAILDAIKNDDPATAYNALIEVDGQLSSDARAEWRQRVAWSFYIENDDGNALALAEKVSEGSGPWVAEGEWVAGLAAWRLGYCSLSAEAFARAAAQSTNVELTTAAHYWAHRALVRCREPGQAQQHLSAAAQYSETMYGMLAADQLGVDLPKEAEPTPFSESDWRALSGRSNVRVAVALTEIGRPALADEVLRHEARTGRAQDFPALARLARELGLPSTQLFMAHYAPYGMQSEGALRYPVARWRPKTGWSVDPALAFAHALQESNFRASAVSPANARGLMQIMPGTARDHNRRLNLGASYADLNDPEVNLAYGQQHLEMLRDSYATQGLLPKIMAAYNAGLTPVSRWNSEINDQGDALLWMESIPYWETRGYVSIVMRNYWMYERAAGVDSPSRRALAQGQWPVFPDMARTRSAQLQR